MSLICQDCGARRETTDLWFGGDICCAHLNRDVVVPEDLLVAVEELARCFTTAEIASAVRKITGGAE